MGIDPELAVVVDMVNAAAADGGAMELDESVVGVFRELSLGAALAYGPGPTSVEATDRTVPGPRGEIPVRVYRPVGDPTGVVVFFHGSGFVIYDLDSHDREARLVAEGASAVVVSVDYALAPEERFPAAVDDCLAATRWVAAHREELGAAGLPLAVMGDSAGGNLAAVVSAELRGDPTVELAAQVLVYPVTDLANRSGSYAENAAGYLLSAETMEFFIACYVPDEADRRDPLVSPLLADDMGGLPPTFVATAEFDPLRDEGEAYAARLDEAGVEVELLRYEGAVHGFFQMSAISTLARDLVDRCCAFLRESFAAQSKR